MRCVRRQKTRIARCALAMIVLLAGAPTAAFSESLDCHPIRRGESAAQVARRITGDSRDAGTSFALLRLLFAARRILRVAGAETMPLLELGADARALAAAPIWRIAVQAAVAAGLIVLLDAVFHLNHAYWAIVTAALVMSGSVADTGRRAVQRAAGTTVGVCPLIPV